MKRFLVLAACMVLLSGCTQSNIVNPESETKIADPNFDIQDDIEIDWTQVSADAESVFEDTGAYPYSKDFHFLLEPQKKEVMLVWVVSDDFPASEIRTYSDNLIKGFNDVVATQDFSMRHRVMIRMAASGRITHFRLELHLKVHRMTRKPGLSAAILERA